MNGLSNLFMLFLRFISSSERLVLVEMVRLYIIVIQEMIEAHRHRVSCVYELHVGCRHAPRCMQQGDKACLICMHINILKN